MSQEMKTALVVTALAFIATGLYPPWLCHSAGDPHGVSLGHGLLFLPPTSHIGGPTAYIDYGRLGLEWLVIAAAGAAVGLLVSRQGKQDSA